MPNETLQWTEKRRTFGACSLRSPAQNAPHFPSIEFQVRPLESTPMIKRFEIEQKPWAGIPFIGVASVFCCILTYGLIRDNHARIEVALPILFLVLLVFFRMAVISLRAVSFLELDEREVRIEIQGEIESFPYAELEFDYSMRALLLTENKWALRHKPSNRIIMPVRSIRGFDELRTELAMKFLDPLIQQ